MHRRQHVAMLELEKAAWFPSVLALLMFLKRSLVRILFVLLVLGMMPSEKLLLQRLHHCFVQSSALAEA